MKIKNLLLTVLSFVLVMALSIGGTMAYLTATDNQVNTMTVGNVAIDQIEQERDGNGGWQDFTQNQSALPAVFSNGTLTHPSYAENKVTLNGKEYSVWSENDKNIVDKFITVKNTGNSDVYFRTIIAIESGDIPLIKETTGTTTGKIRTLCNYMTGDPATDPNCYFIQTLDEAVEINGQNYKIISLTYKAKLAPDETSPASLRQLCLGHNVSSKEMASLGAEWDIIALTQATQAGEWTNEIDEGGAVTKYAPEVALDEAFKEVTAENVQSWFAKLAAEDAKTN